MSEKRLFTVVVSRDDTVRVVSVDVVKETPQFYFITPYSKYDYNDPRRIDVMNFDYSERIPKNRAFTTAIGALKFYAARRNRDREIARAVALQCDKQIESADRLMESLPPADAGATPLEMGATESA